MLPTTSDEIRMLLQQITTRPRRLQNPHDWGDSQTRGICLKRIGVDFYNLKFGRDFAIYFGLFRNQYYIGLTDENMNITEFGKYDSLQELKYEWESD